jgi:hypothetical protein
MKSRGKPIVYNGRTIQMFDRLYVAKVQMLKLKFECINSDWRQGIRLDTDGNFKVNSQTIKKAILFWHDTAPSECILSVDTRKNELLVRNVWDTGDGVEHSWHNGGAMIVEELPEGKRYRCNDGRADEDFDDLIFTLHLI